ncbi:unnamed protein product [Hermetia illucens]|uniref:Uncharacterized protein n=1 Tax=Hermetia illucens TaxID=343691 RepID=A0A7R8YTZ3_HERIL|nr:protein apnoia [Hermetia illucens]CAD7084934.1 unnamed protein product [Hermetia illucens]
MAAVQKVLIVSFALCCLFSVVYCEEDASDSTLSEARTFGHHFLKRISFAVVPAAFVVGMITTLLAALTVVSIKGLGVGVILLILALGQIVGRTFPHVHAAAQYSAPVPVVVSHPAPAPAPLWVEKDW